MSKSSKEIHIEFSNLCISKNISDIVSFYEKNKTKLVKYNVGPTLQKLCQDGDTNLVKWICNTFDVRRCSKIVVDIVATTGNLELLQFFHSIGFDIHRYESCLRLACSNKHLLVAQWLYKMNACIDYETFECACIGGNIEIVNWIIDIYGNDFAKIFCIDYDRDIPVLFFEICKKGNLEIAILIFSYLKQSDIDFRSSNDIMFKNICLEGHVNVVNWIYDKGILSEDVFLKRNSDTFNYLCRHSNLDNTKWFYNFCLEKGHPINIEKNKFYFETACAAYSHEIANWIYKMYPEHLVCNLLKINDTILNFFNFSPSTIYILICCRSEKIIFNVDLVYQVDDIAGLALVHHRKKIILEKLQNKFNNITLEKNNKGKIIKCNIDHTSIKNARKK